MKNARAKCTLPLLPFCLAAYIIVFPYPAPIGPMENGRRIDRT